MSFSVCDLYLDPHAFCVQKAAGEQTKMNVCYICSVTRRQIEKTSTSHGFDHHKQSQHNMLAYVRFIFYIRSKPRNDLTGMVSFVNSIILVQMTWFHDVMFALILFSGAEHYVLQQLKNVDTCWFPKKQNLLHSVSGKPGNSLESDVFEKKM